MSTFSSKELYLMNGGNKVYIYKDGFGDTYNATLAEEAMWAKEVIDAALAILSTDINPAIVRRAIDNLLFHNYPHLQTLLVTKLKDPIPLRQMLFATALWRLFRYEPSAGLLIDYAGQGSECMTDVFLCFGDFKDNATVRKFILGCITGNDEILFLKAKMTLGMWAYSGIPALRENNLLEALSFENKNNETFEPTVKRLKDILDERYNLKELVCPSV